MKRVIFAFVVCAFLFVPVVVLMPLPIGMAEARQNPNRVLEPPDAGTLLPPAPGQVSLPIGPQPVSYTPATPTGPAESSLAPARLEPPDQAGGPATGIVLPPIDLSHLTGGWNGPSPASLPARWDWRERGAVSPVKDQQACGACYAFASLGNFEARLQISGLGNWDFSENNVKECEWYGGSCRGGNYFNVASYLARKGTVLETCDPYVAGDVACNTGCPYQKTLLDWRIISGDAMPQPDVIKNYILNYGPVYTHIYVGTSYTAWGGEFAAYDGSYTLHYTGAGTPNHAVLIVGWDDSLPHAGGTGGWIVKNSWGHDWGGTCAYGTERGYFTIAYGSAHIGQHASFVYDWQDFDPSGDLLLFDEGGLVGARGCLGSTTAWGLARFTPPADTSITRIEFWTTDITTDVDVYVYDDFNGTALTNLRGQVLNNAFGEAGYHSVALHSPIQGRAGDDIFAVVKLTNQTFKYPVPFDDEGPIETGRTYFSCQGTAWTDLGSRYAEDAGIRLRTSTSVQLPTATPTPTPSATASPSATATVTKTATATTTPAASPTATASPVRRPRYLPLVLVVRPFAGTPTPTPSRTPQSSPTPTDDGAGVVILPNHSAFVSRSGTLHVVGEIRNDTSYTLRFVKITARILGGAGQVLADDYAYTVLGSVAPGIKTCFDVLLVAPDGWASYQFDAPSYRTDGQPTPSLAVLGAVGLYDPLYKWYTLSGMLRNDDLRRVEYAKAVGTLYDGGGKAIGCQSAYVSGNHLDPGQISSFGITFAARDYADAAAYALQADGIPK